MKIESLDLTVVQINRAQVRRTFKSTLKISIKLKFTQTTLKMIHRPDVVTHLGVTERHTTSLTRAA